MTNATADNRREGEMRVVAPVTVGRPPEPINEESLSIMLHQLRTPLACIQGFVGLLLEDQVPDSATQREFLTIVQRQTERMTLLVNNLVNMSRLDSVTIELHLEALPVADVVASAVHKLSGFAQDKRIAIGMSLPDHLPRVSGDRNLLELVMINLIENAIKVTPDEGQVMVRAFQQAGMVAVEVRDTGPGVPIESRDGLFTKFHQVADPAGTRARGAGVGLYVARRIIEAHRGRIWAELPAGQGAAFRFALPHV
jgi:signal transduction histidine kinase